MEKKRKIISPQMAAYNKVALIMAYESGATDSNAREIANNIKVADVQKFIEQRYGKVLTERK